VSALTPVSFKKGRPESQPRLSPKRVPGRTHDRYWSPEEDAVMREHYAAHGVAGCKPRLPGRSKRSIYQHANLLGLTRSRGGRGGLRTKPDVDDATIVAGWAELKGRGAVTAFAERLGVSRIWLSDQALRLGLTAPHRKEPPWTPAETALLPRAPLHNLRQAARFFAEHGFRRSPTAIGVRAKREAISRRDARETFSAGAAARVLGVDAKTVTGWVLAGDLEATRRDDLRLPQQGGSAFEIAPEALRQFVLDRLDRIDLRKVEKFAFVALIADGRRLRNERATCHPRESGDPAGPDAGESR
jgi:hypothetical protein